MIAVSRKRRKRELTTMFLEDFVRLLCKVVVRKMTGEFASSQPSLRSDLDILHDDFGEFSDLEVVAEFERLFESLGSCKKNLKGGEKMSQTGGIGKSNLHRCQKSIPFCSILAGKPFPMSL